MGTKVNIMDMQVDLLTKETLKQEMQNFLENETVNVAHVISLDYMDAYDKNELVRESLALANENNRTIYLVLRSEKEAKMVYRFLSEYIDRDQIVGIYVADGEVAEESLINDINMKLPDIVLLSMESTEQEEWLENNRAKVNTKLCVVIGSVMPLLFRENVPVPKWLKKLHLGGVYRWFLVMPYSHSLRRRIFHRKMDDYNTKKKFRR